jgi:hypothetical protein
MNFSETHPSAAFRGQFRGGAVSSHRWLVSKEKDAVRGRKYFAAIVAIWPVIQMFDVLFTIGGAVDVVNN